MRSVTMALLVLAGCPASHKAVDKPVPDAVPKEKPPEVVRPSGPYTSPPVLELSEELTQRIQELESTANDPERLCESVERATSMRYTLGSLLQERFNAVEGTANEKAFVDALAGIDAGLVGVGAGVRGATVSTWLQLPQLKHPPEAADLLFGASEFLGKHDPVYVDVQSEARICARPANAERSLHKIASGWSKAPECVRLALAEDLADVVMRISDARCFCAEKQKALADIGLIAPVLEQLTELDGPVAADELRSGSSGPDAVFGGECML